MSLRGRKSLIFGLVAVAAMLIVAGILLPGYEKKPQPGVHPKGTQSNTAPSSPVGSAAPAEQHAEPEPIPDPTLVDVTFPDGASVLVQLRGAGPFPPAIEPGTYTTHKERALDGDAAVALSVGLTLRLCQYAYSDEEDLHERITELQQTHIAIIEGRDFYTDEITAQIRELRRQHDLCKDIPPDDITAWQDWFVTAARLGNHDAAGMLLHLERDADLPESELNELVRHLREAVDGRYVPALYALGEVYAKGHVRPTDYSGLAYAYAYYYAADSIMRGILPAHIYETTYFGRVWGKKLAALEAQVSPFEIRAGQQMAQEILQSERCCSIPQSLYDNLPKLRSLQRGD